MRLTFWNDRKGHFDWHCENNEIADKLAAYEDTGLTPEEFKESVDFVLELNKKLKPYMDAEKEERLVILPCKVGDAVYALERFCDVRKEIAVAMLRAKNVRIINKKSMSTKSKRLSKRYR